MVLIPFWSYFEEAGGADLRASRKRIIAQVRATLSSAGCELGEELWIDSELAAQGIGERLPELAPAALLVLQTMAVPPAWTATALEASPAAPLLIAALQESAPSGAFDHREIVQAGAAVGAAQLTSTLLRRGRRFRVIAGSLDDERTRGRLSLEARALAAAGTLRGSRLIRLGPPFPGYENVELDVEALRRATGVEVVEVEAGTFGAAFSQAAAEETAAVRGEISRTWSVDAEAQEGDQLERAAKAAVALRRISDSHGACGGAINCHVEEIRLGREPGIAPCFALGRETSEGRPWACTGDLLTTVAMLVLKAAGAPAWYHEIEAFDEARDEALLASSGEHDLGLHPQDGERPSLGCNPWWRGLCARFSPAPGPATLVAFTVASGTSDSFRVVVTEGHFTARRSPGTGTVNAGFSFRRPVARAWEEWVGAGVGHHAAASTGHRAAELVAIADHLGIPCTVV